MSKTIQANQDSYEHIVTGVCFYNRSTQQILKGKAGGSDKILKMRVLFVIPMGTRYATVSKEGQ